MIEDIAIVGSSPALKAAARYAEKDGHRVVWAEAPEALAARKGGAFPPVVITEYGRPDLDALVQTVAAAAPSSLLLLVVDAADLESAARQWRNRIDEFVLQPVTETALAVAVGRSLERVRLRLGKTRKNGEIEAGLRRQMAETIETERFLAVQQIVDKLYTFISRIAADVQGGVKYFNELPYFVSIHSRDQRVLAANRTDLQYLGNRIARNSWEIYVGRRGTPEACPVGRTIRTASVQETRALVRYRSGARVPVLVHTAPIYNNEGEIDLVIEVFAGTQEIERMSREIRSTQQRYEQLFDAVPSKIAVLDRRFRLAAVNRRFHETFGDCLGENFFDILRPGSFPPYRDPISRTVREGIPHEGEMVLSDRHGKQYNMMAWTSPITTATGKLIQVLVIFADLTEVRRLQDSLSSLGLMMSTISHDIKGCLTGLDTGLYLIDKGFYRNTPGRIEEGLDVAKLMVDRIRKLAMGVLYSAKERELEAAPIDLHGFAEDVAANVRNRILAANVRFVSDIPPSAGMVEIDEKLLRSALINLLDNAIEACVEDSGEKDLEIRFSVRPSADHVVFEIADNGAGMSKESRARAFELFYSSKGQHGTGLGLFVTRKVVHKHGGTISFDSKSGRGSRFTIGIPRRLTGVIRTSSTSDTEKAK